MKKIAIITMGVKLKGEKGYTLSLIHISEPTRH